MRKSFLHTDQLNTPIGLLLLTSDGESLLRIDYMSENKLFEVQHWADKHFQQVELQPIEDQVLEDAKQQLTEYFTEKRQTFDIPIVFLGTDFQRRVWQALYEDVPYGLTQTYKGIAAAIHHPNAVRAVGGAVNKNPLSIIVPCHRIVGSNGKLVGYNGGLDKKQYLLDHELTGLFTE
ncbi:methylated-DNA--[protein]-cysteine S-methyltransferase [Virgibacillus halophilus]|uniref:methylated-DNA--[protein]-cysteine S-methyltransferase n=1 Tax=Tigheibacillus halophilus TaxID=361280 RepID=UPI003643FE35